MASNGRQAALESEFNKLLKLNSTTAASEAQEQVEQNHKYISNVQLKALVELHDNKFRESYTPLKKLYEKYSDDFLRDGDLQNWAELIDRDIRVLETTMRLAKDNQANQ
ncbi:LAMI_0A01926g1_1 [Lachancea mirantina]|uniref:LAMI_0A01926g1_1 n=1 Tax=Lachancea mirantina TaxID=1230905 RepID=A0A1G4IM07_9SACH|nr:LAMI_0A01926g1_1 [Lachancea mirantina]